MAILIPWLLVGFNRGRGRCAVLAALCGIWLLLVLTGLSTGRSGDCNFDNKNFLNGYCGWEHPNDLLRIYEGFTDDMWEYKQGSASRGPYEDHTSLHGGFLLYKGKKGSDRCNPVCQPYIGVIVSPVRPSTTDIVCLHFWYYFVGVNVKNITVSIYADKTLQAPLWVGKSNRSNIRRWLYGQATLGAQAKSFRVAFVGMHKHSQFTFGRDDAALDDILFTDGPCKTCSDNRWSVYCNKQCGKCLDGEPCGNDGLCPACQKGYGQAQCNWCIPRAYIPTGTTKCKPCGYCANNIICFNGTGHCPSGCEFPWKAPLCQECAPGYRYRYDTSQHRLDTGTCEACGHCLNNNPCDLRNGHCPPVNTDGGIVRCEPGYLPPTCVKKCNSGKYGIHCRETCGQCSSGTNCDFKTGRCPDCIIGFRPPLCKKRCQGGTYGFSCRRTCGQCLAAKPCHFITGECENCDPGKTKPFCIGDCVPGQYGDGCTLKCGNCAQNKTCQADTGACPGGCMPGYYTPFCLKECDDGFYGDCEGECGHCDKDLPCDKKTGHCDNCMPGYPLPFCKDANADNSTDFDDSPLGSPLSITGFTIGISFIGLFLILIIVTLAILVRRFRRQKKGNYPQNVRIRLSAPEVPGRAPYQPEGISEMISTYESESGFGGRESTEYTASEVTESVMSSNSYGPSTLSSFLPRLSVPEVPGRAPYKPEGISEMISTYESESGFGGRESTEYIASEVTESVMSSNDEPSALSSSRSMTSDMESSVYDENSPTGRSHWR